MRRIILGAKLAIAVAAIVALTACSSKEGEAPTSHTISGALTLRSDDNGLLIAGWPSTHAEAMGKRCWGDGGYGDISGGATVTVRNTSGTIIATGALGPGTVTGFQAGWDTDYEVCRFPFEISAVPDADFYSIEVSHRGEVTFSRADLEANGWAAGLTLGD